MEKFLTFMSGKKGTIAIVLGAVVTYLFAKGYIDGEMVALIDVVLFACFGYTSKLTKDLYNEKQ